MTVTEKLKLKYRLNLRFLDKIGNYIKSHPDITIEELRNVIEYNKRFYRFGLANMED